MHNNPEPISTDSIPTVILAGGQSQRLCLNDKRKWQLPFGNKSLLTHIIHRLQQQSSEIVINCQQTDNKLLSPLGLPLINDLEDSGLTEVRGPLTGLISALNWAREHSHQWVVTIPCDTPFFPKNLLSALIDSQKQSATQAVIAAYDEQTHAVFGLWSTSLYEKLLYSVVHEHTRAIGKWARNIAHTLDFARTENGSAEPDPFFNINTLEDYQKAVGLLSLYRV
jgi:molybdopterin-guanine dinucleotide biosynthesis protein A